MALANYTDLQASVAAFLKRSDLTGIIPDLVTLAEMRINGDIDARLQDSKSSLTCTASQEYVASPTDLISIRSITVSSTTPTVNLDYLTPDQFRASYAYGTTGTPQVYTVIGANIYLAPIPDSAYTLECVYKARVPSLAASGTNWLMTTYPHVYLFATLCEAAPYIKDDARIGVWNEKYQESIQVVNSQDWYSGSTMRVRTDVRS